MTISTIDRLVADLEPVRLISPHAGMAFVAATTIFAVTTVGAIYGLRADVLTGRPDAMVLVRGATLLLLGIASLVAVVGSARPAVGQQSTGWRWALSAAAIFPLTALILASQNTNEAVQAVAIDSAFYCLGISCVSAAAIATVLIIWLRRGAPTSTVRVSWLVGLSAGSFGTFAYSLHCPSLTIYYIGLWYTLAIGICAIVARITVPRLIRW